MDSYLIEYKIGFRVEANSLSEAVEAATAVLNDVTQLDSSDSADARLVHFNATYAILEGEVE